MKQNTKFIVVTGGVISGVGKGITTASIGKIMQTHGYNTTLIKIDPYINVDAGTLRPTEHGEVWVTKEGGEIDQDLGTYERFLGIDIPKINNITTGQLYQAVIERERRGEYLGQTVQFIPHLTKEIVDRIKQAASGFDIAVIEIGGTVGDYENVPFLTAFKSIERELSCGDIVYVLVTYLPIPHHINEIKTKPTQQAIGMLGAQGIIPDIIVCRSHGQLDEERRKKIELSAHIAPDYIISAPDIPHVYQMPIIFEQQNLGKKLLRLMKLPVTKEADWSSWHFHMNQLKKPETTIPLAIVGKYVDHGNFTMPDSYISIYHALMHATAQLGISAQINWLDATAFEGEHSLTNLDHFAAIIVPGGFGKTGAEGKIAVINYARRNNIPFLGICYGFQLAAIEYARNVCQLQNAHTTEVDPLTPHPVIDLLPMQKQLLSAQQLGGSMRLGDYQAHITPHSKIEQIYLEYRPELTRKNDSLIVSERHRHRYEVNPAYVESLKDSGFIFSGYHERADGTKLMEFGEIATHPYFVGTQAHPEFKSRFGTAHPLFLGLLQAGYNHMKQSGEFSLQKMPVFTPELAI